MTGEHDSNELRDTISALPYTYDVSDVSSQIRDSYAKYEGRDVSVAGRVMAIRKSGKLLFADLFDMGGKIQCYFDYAALGDTVFGAAKKLNVGDIIGVKGVVFKTKAGEPSIRATKYSLLMKSMRTLPDKWHGIKDTELRYRKRYLDMIMNPEIKELFIKRSKIISSIRSYLDSRGFMEFETPVIQPLYGGADAKPFKVFVNTLEEEHYLRIANELYLKRLVIGGIDKVYEVYKAFRNEDIDSTHSPEFTMIELYQAYVDYNEMMRLTEEMIATVAKEVIGKSQVQFFNNTIRLDQKFNRILYLDSISKRLGIDIAKKSDDEVMKIAEKQGIKFEKGKRNVAHAYDKLFGALVQPELVQPTFVLDFPRSTSPLTRPKRGNDKLVERFELYIAGIEIANSYSELNNPIIQRENFEVQTARMKAGDEEAEPLDMDFVEAMEYGMPPMGGIGYGVDRLAMILTGAESIKEIILFPMEKRLPEQRI